MKFKRPTLLSKFYHLSTAWYHLRRSPYQTLAAIFILTLSSFVISVFILIAGGSEKTLQTLETQPQVIGFFEQPPSQSELEQLRAQLYGIDSVNQIIYTSQEQALEKYRQDNQDNPLLLEMVTANILPASIEVSTRQPEALSQVAEILNLHENIEEVIYQKDVIEQLIKWTLFLRTSGLALISILTTVAFFTVFIIIGMKISLRRKEVEILRLIGASSAQIRWPFIIEAWIYGIISVFLGWGITYITILYVTPYMIDLIWSLQLLPVSYIWMLQLLGLEILISIFWCTLASTWAVNRFLKKV